MGEKKLKEDEMTPEVKDYFLISKAYELRLDIYKRNSTLSSLKLTWNLADENFERAIEKTCLFIPPDRPLEADDQYRDYDKIMVDELKELKLSRRLLYLANAPYYVRILALLEWWLHPAPRKLKKMISQDHIHRFPEDEEKLRERE